MDWLEKIIDARLQEMSKDVYQMRTLHNIPIEMRDISVPSDSEYTGWKPIDSTITDGDINKLELEIGHTLPESFRHYLKYKFFCGLRIRDHFVGLFDHLPDRSLSNLKEHILNYNEPELVIGRSYIYIADFSDYGLLCFDANEGQPGNEYPIVYLDHEDLEAAPFLYAENFRALLEADSDAGNRFIEMLNEDYKNH